MTAIFTESEYEIELSAVQGPAGAQGATGPAGPTGPQGDPGESAEDAILFTSQTLDSGQQAQARNNISAQLASTNLDRLDGTVDQQRALIGSAQVVYTSHTCTSNANLSLNSTTLGTDQTAALQAILDKAQTGPLHVIWDGAYSVTGLIIRGNTTIQALPNCGAILRNGADRPIFRNANQTVNPASIVDKNIAIIGGIWHGNGDNQVHSTLGQGWTVGMEFIGIEKLLLRDCVIYKPRTFATLKINWKKIVCENVEIDVGNPTPGAPNYDGLHFCGPGRFCEIRNLLARTQDDGLAFNANEPLNGSANAENFHPLFSTGGDITDVSVDGVTFADSFFGIRLLSTSSRVDRIDIRNVKGVTGMQAVIIDNYSEQPSQRAPLGEGNFGSISIDGLDVSVSRSLAYKECVVYCAAKIDSLRISNVHRSDFSLNIPTLKIDSNALVRQLTLDEFTSYSTSPTNATNQITNSGQVMYMQVANGYWVNTGIESDGYIVNNSGSIRQLTAHGNVVHGFAGVLQNTGTIVQSNTPDNFVMDASTWLIGSPAWAEFSSSALNYQGAGANLVDFVRKKNAYSSQNVRLSVRAKYTSGLGQRDLFAFVRGNAVSDWSGLTAYACGFLVTVGTSSLILLKHVSGTSTVTATRTLTGGFSSLENYIVHLIALDSGANVNVSARIQRTSDNYWLQADGSFGATEVDAVSWLDTSSVIAGAGRSGLAMLTNNGGTNPIILTDFTEETAIEAPTWEIGPNYTEVSSSGLDFDGVGAATVDISYKLAAYSSPNILLAGRLNFATGTGTRLVILFVRGQATTNWSAQTCYGLLFNVHTGELTIIGHFGGVSTTLTTLTMSGVTTGVNYDLQISAKNNGPNVDLTAKVQRVSDSQWMQTNGTFGASEVVALSTTHTGSVISTAGPSGITIYDLSGAAITLRNFTESAAP